MDLRERWMQYADPIERHRKSRIFRGRLSELQCAEWLETQGRIIRGLEALGGGPDIETTSSEGTTTAFEVKFIGSEDDDFEMILGSVAGQPAGGPVSPYAAINYLLFRAYEAAKQLAEVNGERIAIVIVEDLTWWRFESQLKHSWIDWKNPHFVGDDSGWGQFMREQQRRYSELPDGVPLALRQIDAVWIVKQSWGFEFNVEYAIAMRNV